MASKEVNRLLIFSRSSSLRHIALNSKVLGDTMLIDVQYR